MDNNSNIIGDEPCPACLDTGHDTTGNHLMLFKDGGKYCLHKEYHKSGKAYSVKAAAQNKPKARRRAAKFDASLYGIPNVAYRKLTAQTMSHFSCLAGFDETTGDMTAILYAYGSRGARQRTLPKRIVFLGKTDGKLFGQDVIKDDTLVIVEGENDTMAAYQMLKQASPYSFPAVVGLTNGAGGLKCITDNMEFIQRHKKVIICLDNDNAGKEGTEKLLLLLSGEAYVCQLELNDPHEYLEAGREADFVAALKDAKRHKPSGIISIKEIRSEALQRPEYGLSFPWESLTKATYGMRAGDGYFIGAGAKAGKSELLNELVTHILKEGEKVFVTKAEELPSLTAKKMAGKMAGKMFHKPDEDFDMAELEKELDQLDGRLLMYDRHNAIDWEALKPAIRHAVISEGCKYVFIDPITCMTDGLEASDANTMLQKFSRELDQLAKDLRFTYFVFCHLNAPKTGAGHENGGKVRSNQFTGSRAMMRSCTYMIGIERNKDPELGEEERNMSKFVLLEDRMFGNNIQFDVWYDRKTGSYLEPTDRGEF